MVVSGHDERAFAESIGAVRPDGVTVVVLMGMARRTALASMLIDSGWAPRTPAALVSAASMPQQEVWRGSLGELAAGHVRLTGDGPALIVVGEVARLGLASADEASREAEADRVRERSTARLS
jgi:uroporphyrin-III C-methyltransferase